MTDRMPRTAPVIATSPVHALMVESRAFRQLLDERLSRIRTRVDVRA